MPLNHFVRFAVELPGNVGMNGLEESQDERVPAAQGHGRRGR